MRIRSAFVGLNRLRAGWRFALFVLISQLFGWSIQFLVFDVMGLQESRLRLWNPSDFVLQEGISFLICLVAAWILKRIERNRWSFADYGLPFRGLFGALFWQGVLWGFLAPTILLLMIWIAGGISFGGLAVSGTTFLRYAFLWAVAMLLVGLSEEFLFRGYPLFTLSTGMGFWPASVLLSLILEACIIL